MAGPDPEVSPEVVSGAERSLEVSLGSVGGFELRPTRLFLWRGSDRERSERIVSFGTEPVGLDYERRENALRAGGVEVRALGNPLLTIAIAGAIAFRRWTNPPDETAR